VRRPLALSALLLAATGAGAEARFHEVKTGESLASIAQAELGDAELWPVLYRANRDRIKDPSRIYPGQRIAIPTPDAAPSAPAPDAGDEDDE
jgi:nucleoid-associated protein YgaU